MDAFFFLNSILFGAGLAMDAFSVSVANGLREPGMSRARRGLIAGVYGLFQTAMPLAGWFLVHAAAQRFRQFAVFIPWIALFLLLFIGGEMLLEAFRKREKKEKAEPVRLGVGALLLQGLATSIDALSVGFTIAELDFTAAMTEALIIGAVTFALCCAALRLGGRFGLRLADKAGFVGGGILIAIGIEIFVKGVFFGG
ncbi:MAG: manganese efflux pump [Clostridia bacterium]|nr:manganese efflux pump [Clostridia bacterium]